MNAAFKPEQLSVCEPLRGVFEQLNELVLGKELQLKLSISCLLANGHLLIEDLPGMGKTVLSQALAKVFGLGLKRVQFTNDLLPADLLGAAIYQRDTQSFNFVKGPIFCELLLADEINRASPKTQSALLEAMEERQVSAEGEQLPLPYPFIVIATQNPMDQLGTSALPEAQLDRFLLCISMGYPNKAAELDLLAGRDRRVMLFEQEALLDADQLQAYQRSCQGLNVSAQVLEYLYALLQETRESQQVATGLSTRAALALLNVAKAWAWLSGDEALLPAHIQAVFPYVAGHRLQTLDGKSAGAEHCKNIVNALKVTR